MGEEEIEGEQEEIEEQEIEEEQLEEEELEEEEEELEEETNEEEEVEEAEQEAGDVEEVVGRASEPWREDGYEPFLQRGLEGWTQLYPACSFTGEHPWNAMDWTAKYFGALSHSTVCSECNRWLEEWSVKSWDSGNWGTEYECLVYESAHERTVPRVSTWLEGHPNDAGEFHEWDCLDSIVVVETSLDEILQHQADAREQDESSSC